MILGTTPRLPSAFSIFMAAVIFACALSLNGEAAMGETLVTSALSCW